MKNPKWPAVRAFLFDLDGTLIDSKLDLAHSVNAMLREMGREGLPHETVAGYVGHGAPQLVARALRTDSSEQLREAGLKIFLRIYEKHLLDLTRAYPGVEKGLALLASKNCAMAVLSNKPATHSLQILEGLQLSKYFCGIFGGDSFPAKKPDPDGALRILKDLEIAAEESAMVGDSDVDIQTARNAGMLSAAVTYGFGQHDRVAWPADLYVNSLAELTMLTDGESYLLKNCRPY